MRIAAYIMVLCGLSITVSCQANSVNTPAPLDMTVSPDADLTATPVSPMGDIQMTPADTGLQSLIDKAITDLAQRLAVSVHEIALLEATSVTWPDGSLGCPQEGMVYAQVLTPGYVIRLQFEDRQFEYHASRGTEVVYCESPMPPVPGTPGDV